MDDEQSSVLLDEFILRRIAVAHFDPSLDFSITPQAFRPTEKDITGISFFREKFISAFELAQTKNSGNCYVARILASEFKKLGLTLKLDQVLTLKGHIIVPELSRPLYKTNEIQHKIWHVELAKLFSKNIVHRPSSLLPTS